MTLVVPVAVVAAVLACAGFVPLARYRQWRLGGWSRIVARTRTVEVRAGQKITWVRVGRDQWCERCETSYWWVRPHPLLASRTRVVFVLCEPCHRDLSPAERLRFYARWWIYHYDRQLPVLDRLPHLERLDRLHELRQEMTLIRDQVELGY